MTEPVYLTKDDVQDMIVKALEKYHEELIGQLTVIQAETAAKLTASVENAVQYGDSVALQADKGLYLCAEEGGPTVEKDPFTLSGRSMVGPWESWSLVKGQ